MLQIVAPVRLSLAQTTVAGSAWPGQILRQKAAPVDFESVTFEQRRALAEALVRAMFGRPRASGLAAPMVGVSLRIIALAAGGRTLVMANPQIIDVAGELLQAREGNVSLPGVTASVARRDAVTVRWQSLLTGATREEHFSGWLGRIVQHELEVLDGRMFIDDLPHAQVRTIAAPHDRAVASLAVAVGEPGLVGFSALTELGIVTLPNPLLGLDRSVLRIPAQDLEFDNCPAETLRGIIGSLFLLQFRRGGIGLAAPQAGLGLRIAVINDSDRQPLALINPAIIDTSQDTDTRPESCLSLPGLEAPIERHTSVRIRNHSLDGAPSELDLSGHIARIVQHEIDHLDGVLLPDRVAAEAALSVVSVEQSEHDAVQALFAAEASSSRARAQDRSRDKTPSGRRRAGSNRR